MDRGLDKSLVGSEAESASPDDFGGVTMMDFERVLIVIGADPSLFQFKQEYAKLLGALKHSAVNSKKLSTKVRDLNAELIANAAKVQQALRLAEDDNATIDDLKKRQEKAWEMLEASSAREEAANAVADGLRADSVVMSAQLASYARVLGDSTIEEVVSARDAARARVKDAEQTRDAERVRASALSVELNTRSERYREKKAELKDAERQIAAKNAEEAKNARSRAVLEADLQSMKAQLNERSAALETAKKAAAEVEEARAKLARALEQQRAASATSAGEGAALRVQLAKSEADRSEALERVAAANEERASFIKSVKTAQEETSRAQSAIAKLTVRNEATTRDLEASRKEVTALRAEMEGLRSELAGGAKELAAKVAAANEAARTVALLEKAKTAVERKAAAEVARTSDAKAEVAARDAEVSAVSAEVARLMGEAHKMRIVIGSLERERTREREAMEGVHKTLLAKEEEVRLKETQAEELERREGELRAKLKAATSLYESMRAERNSESKALAAATEEVTELKRKAKVADNQLEHLKEDIHVKDKAIITEQFEVSSFAKRLERSILEVDQLKRLLDAADDNVARQDAQLGVLSNSLRRADNDAVMQKRAFDALISERDTIATHLTRRNDELALLAERRDIQAAQLAKGETQYAERLEDIRLLKIKIADLRREAQISSLGQGAATELKRQVVGLQHDLLREQAKVRALSSEMENPMNVHRWRKLEGSDPELFELTQRFALIQKRLIVRTEEVAERDLLLADKEKTITELQTRLASAPGADILEQLTTSQQLLSERTRALKAMASESGMWQAQAAEAKHEEERLLREVAELKGQLRRRGKVGGGGGGAGEGGGATMGADLLPQLRLSGAHPGTPKGTSRFVERG